MGVNCCEVINELCVMYLSGETSADAPRRDTIRGYPKCEVMEFS
jgi:hypothetical protein